MTKLSQSGVDVDLQQGWEARFRSRPATAQGNQDWRTIPDFAGHNYTVLHVANFAVPSGAGDFGDGAVDIMGSKDVLITLCEYGPESLGTALFAAQGFPTLTIDDFGTTTMQHHIEGQGGCQKFFTINGRAFCLYVVLGSYVRRFRTVPLVNEVIRGIVIS